MKTKMKKVAGLILFSFFVITSFLSSQSLFEQAMSKDEEKPYELNGYLKGTLFLGKFPDNNSAEIKSGYGEASLKLRLRKQGFGDAFADVRFRRGHEFQESVSEINLREAYVNAYAGPFDFRVGHQIVVWGRADGWNPTDNITPKNMLIRSADEDDRRLANFLIRSYYNMHPFRFEVIWVPVYSSSYIPTDIIAASSGINLVEPDYPDMRLKNSTIALRLNLELPSVDGSVSYFNGHNPMPGITADFSEIILANKDLNVFPKSYRMHVFGADFSTVISGSLGLRGELAYRRPHQDYEKNVHIPNPDLQYIIGIDFSGVVLQYIGRYVINFEELEVPMNPSEFSRFKIALKNRVISFQQHELSHSLSGRAAWKWMNALMSVEVFGLVNFTSEEILFRPKLTYDIADALTVALGAELYTGPDDTLFGLVDSTLSAVFVELKASF